MSRAPTDDEMSASPSPLSAQQLRECGSGREIVLCESCGQYFFGGRSYTQHIRKNALECDKSQKDGKKIQKCAKERSMLFISNNTEQPDRAPRANARYRIFHGNGDDEICSDVSNAGQPMDVALNADFGGSGVPDGITLCRSAFGEEGYSVVPVNSSSSPPVADSDDDDSEEEFAGVLHPLEERHLDVVATTPGLSLTRMQEHVLDHPDDVGYQLVDVEDLLQDDNDVEDDRVRQRQLINKHIVHQAAGYFDMYYSGRDKCQLELFKILKDCNAPLYMYDQIVSWACRGARLHGIDFYSDDLQSRQVCMRQYLDIAGMKQYMPYSVPLKLAGSEKRVSIVKHEFMECIYSLLSCPILNDGKGYIFPGDYPGHPPPAEEPDVLSDIVHGSVFRDAWGCKCPSLDEYRALRAQDVGFKGRYPMLSPLLFWMDGTQTDAHGNLPLDPMILSLGHFSKNYRHRPDCWHTTAQLARRLSPKTNTGRQNLQDLHTVLKEVLAPLASDTLKGGIDWNFTIQDQVFKVRLHMPVLFVSADNKEHDQQCCHYQLKTKDIKSYCRCCNCPSQETANPHYKWNYINVQEIQKLVEAGKVDALKVKAFHCIDNAWFHVPMCDECRGILGACPCDHMHSYSAGLDIFCQECFFGMPAILVKPRKLKKAAPPSPSKLLVASAPKSRSKKAKKNEDTSRVRHNKASPTNWGWIPDEKLSTNSIFSGRVKSRIDELSKIAGRMLLHQSNRGLPGCYFPQGITKQTKKAAHEQAGVLVDILIILCSAHGAEFSTLIGTHRLAAWIVLLEIVIVMEKYFKNPEFDRRHLKRVKQFLIPFLTFLDETTDKDDGCGPRRLKLHLLQHIVDDILRFGPADSFNTSCRESSLKSVAKAPAQRTSWNSSTFEMQAQIRYVENLAIDFCSHAATQSRTDELQSDEDSVSYTGRDIVFHVKSGRLLARDAKKHKYRYCNDFIYPPSMGGHQCKQMIDEFISELVPHLADGESRDVIHCWTETKRNGLIFRCHPLYNGGVGWNDWAYIGWGRNNFVPAHILLFIEIDLAVPGKEVKLHDSYIAESGVYAICHSVEQDPFQLPAEGDGFCGPCHPHSKLTAQHDIEFMVPQHPESGGKLYLIPADSIHSTCIAIPFEFACTGQYNGQQLSASPMCKTKKYSVKSKGEPIPWPHWWLFFRTPDQWDSVFTEFVDETLQNKPRSVMGVRDDWKKCFVSNSYNVDEEEDDDNDEEEVELDVDNEEEEDEEEDKEDEVDED